MGEDVERRALRAVGGIVAGCTRCRGHGEGSSKTGNRAAVSSGHPDSACSRDVIEIGTSERSVHPHSAGHDSRDVETTSVSVGARGPRAPRASSSRAEEVRSAGGRSTDGPRGHHAK